MLNEEILSRIKERYVRRYTVTLAPTDENIREALRVARTGVMEKLGIYQAIVKTYGYRYRRMENFIRECGLWTREGWTTWDIEVKVWAEWVTITNKGLEVISGEISYVLPTPPAMIYFANQEDKDFLADLFYAVLEAVNFAMRYTEVHDGFEILEREDVWDWEDYSVVDIDVSVIDTRKSKEKAYAGKVKALISNFSPFLTLVPPDFEILEVESWREY